MKTNNDIDIKNFDKEEISFALNKENNFSVPQNYFDYLPEKIMDNVRINSIKKTGVYFIFRPVVAFSSVIILSGIIYLVTLLLHKGIGPAYDGFLSGNILSDNEIQNIINDPGLYNIDENEIDEQYLASTPGDSDENENTGVNISDDEIKSYLEENTDINYTTNQSQTTPQQ